MRKLRNHPFPVTARLDRSVVLTFAVPIAQLEKHVPHPLELDTFNDQWAFLAAAFVKTTELRPSMLPRIFGKDFLLAGYRVFVRYRTRQGRRLRGLYILGSHTDNRSMATLGSLFTRYRYDVRPVRWTESAEGELITCDDGLRVGLSASEDHAVLPADSPFADWREARRFAGPMPFTFSVDPDQKEVLIIEGARQDWKPKPITVIHHEIPFLRPYQGEGSCFAAAFQVDDVPYRWEKGQVEAFENS